MSMEKRIIWKNRSLSIIEIIITIMPELKIELDEFLETTRSGIRECANHAAKRELHKVVMPATVAHPLDEITKLSTLIKAHATKVGIIYLPDNIGKDSKVCLDTASKLFDTLKLLILVVAQMISLNKSILFKDSIQDCASRLIEACSRLAEELFRLVERFEGPSGNNELNENGERLVLVGLVWAGCDEMKALISRGELGELTINIKQSIQLIDDGFEEFEEWARDPQEMDDDDFGFDLDDDSDSKSEGKNDDSGDEHFADSDEENDGLANDLVQPPSNDKHTTKLEELSIYSQRCVRKIGLVKLLLSSLKLSLPKETSGYNVDKLYNCQVSVAHLIDKLIVELMMNFAVTKAVLSAQTNLNTQAHTIAKIAMEVHENNEQKRNWYRTWVTKFDE